MRPKQHRGIEVQGDLGALWWSYEPSNVNVPSGYVASN